jgi:queuosine precursor transporter
MKYKYFDLLLIILVLANLIPTFVSTKIVNFWGISATGGTFVIPFAFIVGGLISEIYGSKAAWRGSILSIIAAWVTILTIQLIGFFPADPEWKHQEEYQTIFNSSFRIVFAGLIAFLASMYSRIYLLKFLQKFNFPFSLRNYTALFVTEAVNQGLFITISFYGVFSNELLFKIIWQGYVILVLVEIIVGLVLPYLANWLKQNENLD